MKKRKREYENKVLIDKENFLKVLRELKLKLVNNELILNHYFDTINHDIFSKTGVLRIKEIFQKKKSIFNVVFKKAIDKNYVVEHSDDFKDSNSKVLNDWKIGNYVTDKYSTFCDLLLKYEIVEQKDITEKKILYLGKFVIHRYIKKFNQKKIIIDHCTYNGVEDYELICIDELNNDIKAEKELLTFCKKYNIVTLNTKVSKYARFLNSIKK